mmetsp:Transcript_5479/g.8651  ORF Transcript_5479/g.8651 Transcript_5479/m.8651 type:complete len:111 (-) Transcript_5479:12-344(-)
MRTKNPIQNPCLEKTWPPPWDATSNVAVATLDHPNGQPPQVWECQEPVISMLVLEHEKIPMLPKVENEEEKRKSHLTVLVDSDGIECLHTKQYNKYTSCITIQYNSNNVT